METELSMSARLATGLYTIMMQHFRAERYEKAEKMAHDLLVDPSLPVLIRARCHVVLAMGDDSAIAFEHAQEAVNILKAAKEHYEENGSRQGAFPDQYLDEAMRVLACAKKDLEEDAEQEDAKEESLEGSE
ncbi:hypothetical protein LTS10_003903 [Elasticomyces elasticus]|nr:hypothetical protein LTS10_003903 [Elasticomyces elasticus]